MHRKGRFSVYVAGTSGPVVLCCHGGGYTGTSWSLVASQLKDKCVNVACRAGYNVAFCCVLHSAPVQRLVLVNVPGWCTGHVQDWTEAVAECITKTPDRNDFWFTHIVSCQFVQKKGAYSVIQYSVRSLAERARKPSSLGVVCCMRWHTVH
jgi:hypothetical protein